MKVLDYWEQDLLFYLKFFFNDFMVGYLYSVDGFFLCLLVFKIYCFCFLLMLK